MSLSFPYLTLEIDTYLNSELFSIIYTIFTLLSSSFYLFQKKIQSLQHIRTLNTLAQASRKGFVHFLLNTKIQSGF